MRRIAGGLQGAVWLAEDLRGRHVVLKQVARTAPPSLRLALRREALNLRQCQGPGIVRLLDQGVGAEGPWLVLAWEDIDLLPQAVTAAATEAEAIHALTATLRPLACLHQRGWLHLDLKPQHVGVDTAGRGWLLDLGNARPLRQAARGGVRACTPAWCAPEQRAGVPLDTRTDVYALGRILQWARQARRWNTCAAGMDALLQDCLQPAPSQRPVDAGAVLQRLGQVTRG